MFLDPAAGHIDHHDAGNLDHHARACLAGVQHDDDDDLGHALRPVLAAPVAATAFWQGD
jgi:hypothetical protein